jgi:hypothetical protein
MFDSHKLFLLTLVIHREMAMLMSLLQANPQLVMQMGKAFQQIAVEVKRKEKLDQLEVRLFQDFTLVISHVVCL